jgi:hypothetical protein
MRVLEIRVYVSFLVIHVLNSCNGVARNKTNKTKIEIQRRGKELPGVLDRNKKWRNIVRKRKSWGARGQCKNRANRSIDWRLR